MSNTNKIFCHNGDDCKFLKRGECRFSHEKPKPKKTDDELIRESAKTMAADYLNQNVMTQDEFDEFVYQCDRGIQENMLCFWLHRSALRSLHVADDSS